MRQLNPARWLTALACWWLHLDKETVRSLQAADQKQEFRETGDSGKLETLVKITASASAAYFPHKPKYTLPGLDHNRVIEDTIPKLYDWDFDMFTVREASDDRPLYTITLALLEDQKLLDHWKLDRATVQRFLAALETQYRHDNPYHNNTHAADVTQTAAVILRSLQQQLPDLTPLEVFSIILASAIHDLGHPGVNNDFLINSRARQALLYNDKSVNENHHASAAFQLALNNEELNIFAGFSREEFKQIRQLVIAMVLSTDMAIHFELLERFGRAMTEQPVLSEWKDRSLLFQMVVHLADLANPSRPFPIAKRWAELVVQEFMDQGDKESALGLPVSPMCNKEKKNMPKAQLGFISIFLRPTLQSMRGCCTSFVDMAMGHLHHTEKQWAQLEAEGMR